MSLFEDDDDDDDAQVDPAQHPAAPVRGEDVEQPAALLTLDPDQINAEFQRVGPMISRQGRRVAEAVEEAMIAEAERKAVEAKLSLKARYHLHANPIKVKEEDGSIKTTKPTEPLIDSYWKNPDGPFYMEWMEAIRREAKAVAAKKREEADYNAVCKQADHLVSIGADRRAEMNRLGDGMRRDPAGFARQLSEQVSSTLGRSNG